jgi:hypothetical protein
MIRGKKGGTLDGLVIGIMALIVVFVGAIALYAYSNIDTAIQASTALSTAAKASSSSSNTQMPGIIDGIFITMYVLLALFAIFGAFLVNTTKFFMLISIILLAIMGVIGMILSNIYVEVGNNTILSTMLSRMPMANFVMSNFLVSFLLIIFSIFIALYAKSGSSGGNFA